MTVTGVGIPSFRTTSFFPEPVFLEPVFPDHLVCTITDRVWLVGCKFIPTLNDATGFVPPNVQADLLKFTIRAAGLDGSKDQAANAGAIGTALQININL